MGVGVPQAVGTGWFRKPGGGTRHDFALIGPLVSHTCGADASPLHTAARDKVVMRSHKPAPTTSPATSPSGEARARFSGTIERMNQAALEAVEAAREARGHDAAARLRESQPGLFLRLMRALRLGR